MKTDTSSDIKLYIGVMNSMNFPQNWNLVKKAMLPVDNKVKNKKDISLQTLNIPLMVVV